MSLCCVYSFFPGKGGHQARQIDLIRILPVPPLTLYSYLNGTNWLEKCRGKTLSTLFLYTRRFDFGVRLKNINISRILGSKPSFNFFNFLPSSGSASLKKLNQNYSIRFWNCSKSLSCCSYST